MKSKQSYCGACYPICEEYERESIWIFHSSIFHSTPPNGPLLRRPTLQENNDSKPKYNTPPPMVGFGFNAAPVSKPGENYSDYQTPLNQEVEEALLLKKTSAPSYYDDDESSQPKASVTISSPSSAQVAMNKVASPPKKNPNSPIDQYLKYEGYESGYGDGDPTQAQPVAAKTVPTAAPKKAPAAIVDPYAETEGYGDGGYYGTPTQAQPAAVKKAPTAAPKKAPAAIINPYAETEGYGDGGYYGTPTQAQSVAAKPVPKAAPKKAPAAIINPYAETEGYGDGGYYGTPTRSQPAAANKVPAAAPKKAPATIVDPYAETYGSYSTSSIGSTSFGSDSASYQYSEIETGSSGAYTEPPSLQTSKTDLLSNPKNEDDRDWNEEFQVLIAKFAAVMKADLPNKDSILKACGELYALSANFIQNAESIGRVIIEEVSIPGSSKTIKPVNVGGVAGGEKYVKKGIFFKFAIDAFGVYGGDEYAQKAAGHELGGLKAYYNCRIEGLNTPFMLLMDYRGYRLIATTKLPIGSGSLIYGSADGGVTIHKDDPTLNAMMQRAAEILNIKPHVVGMRNQTDVLYAPTDIEGHKGHD